MSQSTNWSYQHVHTHWILQIATSDCFLITSHLLTHVAYLSIQHGSCPKAYFFCTHSSSEHQTNKSAQSITDKKRWHLHMTLLTCTRSLCQSESLLTACAPCHVVKITFIQRNRLISSCCLLCALLGVAVCSTCISVVGSFFSFFFFFPPVAAVVALEYSCLASQHFSKIRERSTAPLNGKISPHRLLHSMHSLLASI